MAEEELTEFEKLNKAGVELLTADKLTESEEKLAEALKIASGADQKFQVVRSLLNLAGKYIKLKDCDQPKTLYFYLQRVDVEERTRVMELLASLYKQMDDLPGAERIYTEIYDLRLDSLGPNHPDTMGILQTAAMLLQMQGKSPEALYAKAYNATRIAAIEERERSPLNQTAEIPVVNKPDPSGARTLTDMQSISHLLTATSKLPKLGKPKNVEESAEKHDQPEKESESVTVFMSDEVTEAQFADETYAAATEIEEQRNSVIDTQELPVQSSENEAAEFGKAAQGADKALAEARALLNLATGLAESAAKLSEQAAALATQSIELALSNDASGENMQRLQDQANEAMHNIAAAKEKFENSQTKIREVAADIRVLHETNKLKAGATKRSAAEIPQRITIADIQAAAAAAAAAQTEAQALLEARANISPEAMAKIKTTSSSPLSMIDDVMQGSSAVEQEPSITKSQDAQPEIVTKHMLLEPGWQAIINQWEQFCTSFKIRMASVFQQSMPAAYTEVMKKNQELFEKAYPKIKQIDFRFVFEDHDQLEDEIRADVDVANAFKRIYSSWDANSRFTPHEIGATYAWLRRSVSLGLFHQDSLRSLFRLGMILMDKDRPLPKSEQDLGLKLMRFVRAASDNHPKFKVLDRIRNATMLAKHLLQCKQPEEALSLFNIAYRAAKTCDDVSPSEMTDLLKNLAMCHETMGNIQGATDLLERIRRVQEAMSRNSEDLCETTIHLLANYKLLNNEQAATACQQRILCELDWLEKPNPMKLFAAGKCEELAQMDLAEQLCKDVLAQSDGDDSSPSKALVLLARVYQKTGRAKEADRIKIVLSRTGN